VKNSIVVLACVVLGLGALPGAASDAQLRYVVIVTRHGVRSPTWEMSRLNRYSAEPWPDFGVPPGNLTPHGRRAIELMGASYRTWLTSESLIHSSNCKDASRIRIYADKDQRTIETGRALAESLMPGCGVNTASQPGGKSDPLFAGTFKPDPQAAAEALRERLDPQLLEHHRAAFDALQAILGPASERPIGPVADVLKGPFATGSSLSEDLLLEYANGEKNPGWGRLTKENLFQVLEIHAIYADLTRRTPYLAHRGANLLLTILQSLRQAETGTAVTGAIGQPGDAVLVISGHDTNLSNLSGLLALHWHLPGYQPDDTPPGGALIFSLWRETSGEDIVRLRYAAQTVDQMRALSAEPPVSQEVYIPGCEPCRLNAFGHVVESLLRP
jgi:4-phytase/acid phosphatase